MTASRTLNESLLHVLQFTTRLKVSGEHLVWRELVPLQPDSGVGVEVLRFWGLGLRVWGLGFGVWGLGIRV